MNRAGYSLRAKLLLWLLPLMVVFMWGAWLIHGALLDRMTADFVESRLRQEARFLERQLEEAAPSEDLAYTAGRYFEDVFHHAFAIRLGHRTYLSSTQLASVLEPALEEQGTRFLRAGGGSMPELLLFRHVARMGDEPLVIVVAEDLTTLRDSQSELHAWTAAVAIGLLGVLIVLVLLAVYLALKPVRSLQGSLQAFQEGRQARLELTAPREFLPLIRQINHLLDRLDQRLERSRQALANLSHSIKTPIAAIQQALEDTQRPLDDDYRRRLAARLSDIDHQLEAEMRRTRFAGPDVGKQAHPVQQAHDLVWMLGRLHPEKNFELNTDLPNEFTWSVEEHDLSEMLGNLLDNAGKWANRHVSVTIIQRQNILAITVTDDGPGVAAEELPTLGTRGLRLDQQKPGHGLGLAIVRDLIARYEGRLGFRQGDVGGLVVTLELPRPGFGRGLPNA
ncbi:two-component system sensor histidine kinase CarS [Marinobacter nanhaiticus D15-8W]|nr:two-component system sensor histidine kinase CarS [Marinobacter nanhaiticus D15-8W]